MFIILLSFPQLAIFYFSDSKSHQVSKNSDYSKKSLQFCGLFSLDYSEFPIPGVSFLSFWHFFKKYF